VNASSPSPKGPDAAAASFTCAHYDPQPGSKRCRHYVERGACALPTEFMCVEWMRANNQGPAQKPQAPAPQAPERPRPSEAQRDLFGRPTPPAPAAAPAKPKPVEPRRPAAPEPGPEPAIEPDPLRGLTTEDLDSFKALGVEVCFRSEALGEVWLVPAPTGQPRRELTPEHAATIVRVLSAFPGSHVVALHSKHEPAGSKEEAAP